MSANQSNGPLDNIHGGERAVQSAGVHDSVDELAVRLREFARERDWEQFHTPKNLAMALAGEAGELLAELQWLTPEQSASLPNSDRSKVADEMADVLNYLIRMADVLDIDLIAAANRKIDANGQRYSKDVYRGSASKAPPVD